MGASRALEHGREGPQSDAAGTQQALQTIPALHWEKHNREGVWQLWPPTHTHSQKRKKCYESRECRCKLVAVQIGCCLLRYRAFLWCVNGARTCAVSVLFSTCFLVILVSTKFVGYLIASAVTWDLGYHDRLLIASWANMYLSGATFPKSENPVRDACNRATAVFILLDAKSTQKICYTVN